MSGALVLVLEIAITTLFAVGCLAASVWMVCEILDKVDWTIWKLRR